MGQGRTAKAVLCFAIIHLPKKKKGTKGCKDKDKILSLLHCKNPP